MDPDRSITHSGLKKEFVNLSLNSLCSNRLTPSGSKCLFLDDQPWKVIDMVIEEYSCLMDVVDDGKFGSKSVGKIAAAGPSTRRGDDGNDTNTNILL